MKLPIVVRNESCVVSLDVTHDEDGDRFAPWLVGRSGLALVEDCFGEFVGLGGKKVVGPRGVVTMMVLGRAWPVIGGEDGEDGEDEGLLLEVANGTSVADGIAANDRPEQLNATTPPLIVSRNLNGSELYPANHCVNPLSNSVLYDFEPVNEDDCFQAAHQVIENRPRNIPLSFGRNPAADFPLPKVYIYKSCRIGFDVTSDWDEDRFDLWTLYGSILMLAEECTNGVNRWGGKRKVGPGQVVKVVIHGNYFPRPQRRPKPTTLMTGHVIARGEGVEGISKESTSISRGLHKPIISLPSNTESVISNTSLPNLTTAMSTFNGTMKGMLGSMLTCSDPPLPRERLYPINVKDCEQATEQLLGGRAKHHLYLFSRKKTDDPFSYHLPARFVYGNCVVRLDMDNDKDEEVVRIGYVEASAWVLAHKCCGEENPGDKYGGHMRVGVGGAEDLINIWVYGRIWPRTGVLEGRSESLIGSE